MDTATAAFPVPLKGSRRRRLLAAVGFAALLPAVASAQEALPEIEVIATSPLQGAGIERDKVPAMVQTLTSEDFERTKSLSVIETLVERIPGVSTSDVQGNSFVQDVRYRGFVASPVPGTPQGLAVYLNGIRVNEAFGDTVNWDMIPTNAISRADIWTNNPVFGLNALGGAINLGMKNGFTWQGFEADAQGGRFGRVQGGMQYGAKQGDIAVYVAAQAGKDDGWRFQSPSELARIYADIGWKGERSEVHLIANGASNFFGVVGPTPVELLARDDRAVYTFPQTTQNQMGLLSLNGQHAVTDTFTVQANTYVRRFQQRHVDGNTGPRPNPITPAFRNRGHGRLRPGHQHATGTRLQQLLHHGRQHRPWAHGVLVKQRARLHLPQSLHWSPSPTFAHSSCSGRRGCS